MVVERTKVTVELVFGVVVAILNLGEVILLGSIKGKRRPYESLLLSLSIADFLFGLSNVIVCALFLSDQTHEEIMEITYTTYFFFVFTSILHLTLISFDRLWAVAKPIHHNVSRNTKKFNIAILCIWILSMIISITLIVYDETSEGFKVTKSSSQETFVNSPQNGTINGGSNTNTSSAPTNKQNKSIFVDNYPEIMQTTLASIIIIADFFFICANSTIVYIMQRKKNKLNKDSFKMENKASIMCILISIVFIIFTLPYSIGVFTSKRVPLWSSLLLILNSAMNSIVYFFRSKLENCFSRNEKNSITETKTTPLPVRGQKIVPLKKNEMNI